MSTAAVTTDPWAQYAEKPAAAGGSDSWAQYAEKPNAGLAPPAGAPPAKGTLPNNGDTGEGSIARNLTSFESQLSRLPENAVRTIGAKHWPIVDAHNFHELGEDFKSFNPVVKTGGETDYGATAANLLPVDVGGEGIGESPIGRLTKTTVPPMVRGVAKGTNAVLQKAPGTVGAAIGGAIGHASHVPMGGEAGAIIGGAAGREILPKLRIPGEGFGFPNRVTGGPRIAPPYKFTDPGGPLPEHPGVFPGAHLPENPGTFPGAHLPEHPGFFPGAPLPESPAPEVLQANSLGRGPQRIADPAAALEHVAPPGKAGSMVRSISQPENTAPKITTAPVDPGKIGDLLNEGLGGKLPEGHTEVKGSSLIRSYKYDPATKQFDAALHGDRGNPGGIYVHGEVEPETAAKFEAAKSKGQAWKALKDTPGVTYLGKRMNGELVPAKPPRDLGSASPDDLTPLLKDSLDAAKAKKASRIARPN